MLPGISHHQQKQAAECTQEHGHLASALGIRDLCYTRVVDVFNQVHLGRAHPARFSASETHPRDGCRLCSHQATPANMVLENASFATQYSASSGSLADGIASCVWPSILATVLISSSMIVPLS